MNRLHRLKPKFNNQLTGTNDEAQMLSSTSFLRSKDYMNMYKNLDLILDDNISSGSDSLRDLNDLQIGGKSNTKKKSRKTTSKSSVKTKDKRKLKRNIENDTNTLQTSKIPIESTAIVDFLNDTKNEDIKANLISFLHSDQFCDSVLGEGYVGKVKVSAIGNTHTISYEKLDVVLPVAIKESQIDGDILAFTAPDTHNLYLYCSRGISMEAVILYYIRVLITKKKSPHLPLIIGHSKCDSATLQPIDRFITERHGWDKEIRIKLDGHYESPLWHPVPDYNPLDPTYKTKLTTFDDLSVWCNLMKKSDGTVTLPNNQNCNIVELLDYISISYIITYDLLAKHNIFLMDMHPQNIFIHWLNKNSYMHDQFIGNTEYIYYKFNKKYYKIKTFGLMMKIGDAGACIINPRKDLYLVGQGNDLYKTYPIVNEITKISKCFDFLSMFIHTIPFETFSKTIAFQIFSSHPYNKTFWLSMKRDLVNDMMSADKLIKYFDKYSVDNLNDVDTKSDSVLLIE